MFRDSIIMVNNWANQFITIFGFVSNDGFIWPLKMTFRTMIRNRLPKFDTSPDCCGWCCKCDLDIGQGSPKTQVLNVRVWTTPGWLTERAPPPKSEFIWNFSMDPLQFSKPEALITFVPLSTRAMHLVYNAITGITPLLLVYRGSEKMGQSPDF